ncbi:MAG: FAD-dependent thymidylate synthase [Anaerolineae bacterium]|nr:FAD-dependent thymidylate synthase [Anaerolineae bacterium]
MRADDFAAHLTPSSEILSPDEARRIEPFFTNTTRSVVALKNLPEVIKGALFSRYSRTAKGVRRLFLDEFLPRHDLGIVAHAPSVDTTRAEDFYRRILADYGDDSVGELGGAHLACQDVSQIAAKAIEYGRIGISYLEKSSRYVPFDDKVNGQYRYYRPRKILASSLGDDYVATLDALFDAYAQHLPRMIEHLAHVYPITALEFEDAQTGNVLRYSEIRDDDFLKSAHTAYRHALRARACDALRCFLPMATLTNVGVWGNGRALEYLLIRLYADPLEEIQTIAHAAHYELAQVIGPFVKRANDDKGKAFQEFLRAMREHERELARAFLAEDGGRRTEDEGRRTETCPERSEGTQEKVTLVHYDADAVERVVAAILYPASDLPKTEILNRVRALSAEEHARIINAYVGERKNRRHKPGRAFEHATYEFDLLLNIGEYRDLQRHRIVTAERQMFTTTHGYTVNDDVARVPEIRAAYVQAMERAAALYEHIARTMPFEAQYVVPFGFRVRYNLRLNLREAYHLIELRSAPQGHPDYRHTAQAMYRALQAVHPLLVAPMQFVDLAPDVPLGRLRAEMRKARI